MQVDVGQAEGLLAEVFDLQFVFLVEPDLAERGQFSAAFVVIVYVDRQESSFAPRVCQG